jgi:outer membrane protein assembly factor BamD (BamD/ComL family)
MSVAGISTSSLYNYSQNTQNNLQQIQQTFQQLGQDLQSGNLSAAQSDFATLQKLVPQLSSAASSTSQSTNPIAQAFSQLAKDLQSGNLSAAQQDFSTIQQDFQNQASESQTQETQDTQSHHHHHGAGSSEISQLLQQLGTALQSGNLSAAQSAFTTLDQQIQQPAPTSESQTGSSQSSPNGVSVTA